MNFILIILLCSHLVSGPEVVSASGKLPACQRLNHNDSTLVTDLGVGLWTSPIALDYDGDGVKDLVVGCPCVPYRGLYYFRNVGTVEEPLFDRAVRISKKASAHQFSSEYNGVPFITDKGKVFDDFFLFSVV